DRAHDPVAFSDLVLHFAGRAVVEIEMVPAITLRGPDNFPAIVQLIAILFSGISGIGNQRTIVDEGGRLLRNHGARLGRQGIDFNHAVNLVTALVVFESKGAAIFAPDRV